MYFVTVKMQTARTATTNDRPQLGLKTGFAALLAFFFGFLLVFGQIAPSVNVQRVDTRLQQRLLRLPEANLFFDVTQPPHSPFESDESYPTDKEGETTDNLDDESDKFLSRSSLKQRLDIAATKRELSQQTLSSANNERVPLFVLHHSWKTFLTKSLPS
jgi:hypothetical protein